MMFDEFNDDEFLKFDRVENKLSTRPDIHAFILLNELFPGTRDMVSGAEHDEIYLDVEPDELKEKATKEQLRDLHRCGVRESEYGICMFA
jgi:hypothetical protein